MKQITLSLFMALMLTGCGLSINQKQLANEFATASATLGDMTITQLSSFREATIQMNSKNVAIKGSAKISDLDKAFNIEDVEQRANAAAALSSYGNLLLALVNDNEESNLRSAANDFVGSARKVSGTKLNDAQLEGLGNVVMGIGGLFIEQQKAEALKKIVSDSKPYIDKACDLLSEDFDVNQHYLLQSAKNTAIRLQADSDMALLNNQDIPSRAFIVDAYHFAEDQSTNADVISAKMLATLSALKQANGNLAMALENDKLSFNDIKNLALNLKDLGMALKVLSGH